MRFQLEIHGIRMREIFEEGQQLYNIILFDDLDADVIGSPLFVDWNNHAATSYRECRSDTGSVSMNSSHRVRNVIPIEPHRKASDGKLESMQVLIRRESQFSYRGRGHKCLEQLGQCIWCFLLRSRAVDCDGHVTLWISEQRKFGRARNR